MITEDYISFETAKLLKEKGFDVPDYRCSRVYNENGTIQPHHYVRIDGFKYISAPTLQMAMKWLREVHHIFIRIIQSHQFDYCACEIYYDRGGCYEFRKCFDSYEEAAEAGIKYSLENLI